ncbi:YoaK family protein [Streptomyces sp. NPDC000880]
MTVESKTAPAAPKVDPRRALPLLFLVTVATGIVEAVCFLHLGHVFSAYATGTVVLAGIRLGGGSTYALAPYAVSLAGFLVGALFGGLLSRRSGLKTRGFVEPLLAETGFLFAAGVVAVEVPVDTDSVGQYVTLALIGVAMGTQVGATKHLGVADMTLPAATGIVHGLIHDSRVAGGTPQRAGRRLGVVLALAVGAAVGAGLANWYVPAAILLAALIVLGVAATARRVLG